MLSFLLLLCVITSIDVLPEWLSNRQKIQKKQKWGFVCIEEDSFARANILTI
jgi:hypothetical protein